MNFAEIENTWRSPHNRPSAAELEKQKMEFVADLRRRRRSNVMLLCLVFVPLAFFTGKIVLHLLWPDPALDKVNLSREWGIIPFFILPWIGWLVMLHLHRQHRARHARAERSISASIAALLDENRTQCTRYKVTLWLLIASVFILPLIVVQLRAVGKAGNEILIPALVVYPAYVVIVVICSTFYYRRKLLPRNQELQALLRSYESSSGDLAG
jgi:hypothetical protein